MDFNSFICRVLKDNESNRNDKKVTRFEIVAQFGQYTCRLLWNTKHNYDSFFIFLKCIESNLVFQFESYLSSLILSILRVHNFVYYNHVCGKGVFIFMRAHEEGGCRFDLLLDFVYTLSLLFASRFRRQIILYFLYESACILSEFLLF